MFICAIFVVLVVDFVVGVYYTDKNFLLFNFGLLVLVLLLLFASNFFCCCCCVVAPAIKYIQHNLLPTKI